MEKFLKFYKENKNKLAMRRSINYPLNYKKGMVWALGQCSKDNAVLAKLIIENTIYVSYEKFIYRLEKVCRSFKSKINKKKFVYVLLIPGRIHKSNTWVSMLAIEYLSGVFENFYSSITEIYNDVYSNTKSKIYNKSIKIIVLDDCIYTGQQMISNIKLDFNTVEYPNKTKEPDHTDKKWLDWWSKTTQDTNSLFKKINKNKFNIVILAPFVSTYSLKKLEQNNIITVFKDNILIYPTFLEQISNTINISNRSKNLFQYSYAISAIIFDHKIADSVSTFNKVYLLAPLFDCNVNQAESFINNCPAKVNGIDIYNNYLDLEKTLESGETCPKTHYRYINYTTDGISISKNSCISYLKKKYNKYKN